jgi:hypothetical protein
MKIVTASQSEKFRERGIRMSLPRSYRMPDGRVLFVRRGIGDVPAYMTVYIRIGKKGAHRFRTRDLPVRMSGDEAQQDLDKYARKRGLKEEG